MTTNNQYEPNQHVFYIKEKVKAVVKSTKIEKDNVHKIYISFHPKNGNKKRVNKLVSVDEVTPWLSKDEQKVRFEKKLVNKKMINVNELAYSLLNEVKPLEIKVKYFADIDKIKKIGIGDWLDLRAAETVELKKGDFKLIKLGVGMKLPQGYEAPVIPRSSLFGKTGVLQANSEGLIDNSYSGNEDEWKFPAYATRDTVINKNDRICQFRIQKSMGKVNIVEVDNLDEVSRGGFGRTGIANYE